MKLDLSPDEKNAVEIALEKYLAQLTHEKHNAPSEARQDGAADQMQTVKALRERLS